MEWVLVKVGLLVDYLLTVFVSQVCLLLHHLRGCWKVKGTNEAKLNIA